MKIYRILFFINKNQKKSNLKKIVKITFDFHSFFQNIFTSTLPLPYFLLLNMWYLYFTILLAFILFV